MARDYRQISRELVRALRGRRSQAAFSRRLGYRTNVVYSWESGRAFPTAALFLEAATRVGVDVRVALTRFYHAEPPWLAEVDANGPELVARLLDDLRGRASIVDLARGVRRSRFAVARWLSGEAEPRLPDFLLMIEKTSLRLLDFLATLVDATQLPSIERAFRELEAARNVAVDAPWTQAVLRALELTDYRALPRHRPGFLACRVGISQEEEERCLQLLAETGQIEFSDQHWTLQQVTALDTRRDPELELGVRAFWVEAALERLRARSPGIFSYNVFAVSEADFQRISDLHRAYFRQVRGIIAESAPSERVVLANLQLVPLDAAAHEPRSPAVVSVKARRRKPKGAPGVV